MRSHAPAANKAYPLNKRAHDAVILVDPEISTFGALTRVGILQQQPMQTGHHEPHFMPLPMATMFLWFCCGNWWWSATHGARNCQVYVDQGPMGVHTGSGLG